MRKRTADFLQGKFRNDLQCRPHMLTEGSPQPSSTGERGAGAKDCQWPYFPGAGVEQPAVECMWFVSMRKTNEGQAYMLRTEAEYANCTGWRLQRDISVAPLIDKKSIHSYRPLSWLLPMNWLETKMAVTTIQQHTHCRSILCSHIQSRRGGMFVSTGSSYDVQVGWGS